MREIITLQCGDCKNRKLHDDKKTRTTRTGARRDEHLLLSQHKPFQAQASRLTSTSREPAETDPRDDSEESTVVVENFAPGRHCRDGLRLRGSPQRINPTHHHVFDLGRGPDRTAQLQAWIRLSGRVAFRRDRSNRGKPNRAPSVPAMAIGDIISTGVASAMAVGFALLNREAGKRRGPIQSTRRCSIPIFTCTK